MSVRKSERGQAIVLLVPALVVILGMAALVVDVGNWYHTKRRLQGTADASALAGAQLLPKDPGGAQSLALTYANKNGGDVAGADISVTSSPAGSNDTISVRARKTDTGIFGGIFGSGFGSADISARAKARVGPPVQAKFVAPMVVFCDHPLIHNCAGDSTPDFGQQTTMDYDPLGAPGAYGMLNLDGGNGTPGSSDEANWILHGFNKYLAPGDYRSDPGAKFSSSNIQDALTARVGTVLLFPVYRQLDGQGQGATYEIIGWIGFHLTSFDVHGNNATLHGYFTEFIAIGILAGSGGSGGSGTPPSSSFGVTSIQLIE
jgi:hypothetical protein